MKKVDTFTLGMVTFIVTFIAGLSYFIYNAPVWKTDNVKYKIEYYRCINNLPAGPESTVYNDWDEVMEECQYLARKLSTYCTNC